MSFSDKVETGRLGCEGERREEGGREEGRYDGKAYAPLEEGGDGVEHGGLQLQ